MKIFNFEQRSPEWFAARAGVLTASNFKTARERLKNGEFSGAAKKLAAKLAIERISGEPQGDVFQTYAMRRGTELEPEALDAYSFACGEIIQPVGFVTTDCGMYGASPDGFQGEHGGVEVKCPIECERVIDLVVNLNHADYMDQIQGNLWITERKQWVLIIYTPQLSGVNKELNTYVYERDEAYIDALKKDLEDFNKLVEGYVLSLSTQKAA